MARAVLEKVKEMEKTTAGPGGAELDEAEIKKLKNGVFNRKKVMPTQGDGTVIEGEFITERD